MPPQSWRVRGSADCRPSLYGHWDRPAPEPLAVRQARPRSRGRVRPRSTRNYQRPPAAERTCFTNTLGVSYPLRRSGQYGTKFEIDKANITYTGLDGAVNVVEFTSGRVQWADLAAPLAVKDAPFDWVRGGPTPCRIPAAELRP